MDSLVEELKEPNNWRAQKIRGGSVNYDSDAPLRAAAAITTLQSENARLQARVEELERLGALVAKILPSAAGLDDAPQSKIIACYLSMGELRAIRQALKEQADADQ